MKNMLKKILALAVVCIMVVTICKMPVLAAGTASVSISGPGNVTKGDQFSVNVNVSGDSIYGISIDIKYDKNIIQLVPNGTNVFAGEGRARIFSDSTTSSFTLTFNAISNGTTSLIMNTESYTIGSMGVESELKIPAGSTPQTSVTVSPTPNVISSSNNNLSSLTVTTNQGANVGLSPSFSSDQTTYDATVPYDCTDLIVGTTVEDSTASVSVSGKRMDPGANTTTVTVKAQNGDVKKYVIRTNRETAPNNNNTNNNNQTTTQASTQTQAATEAPTTPPVVTVKVNGSDFIISDTFGGNALPQGYTAEQADYNGQKISAAKGINGLTVVYLEKTDGTGGAFYVYDVKAKTFSVLSTVDEPDITFTILPISANMEFPNGYKKATYQINGKVVDVLVPDTEKPNYCIFYGVDSKGNAGWYRYDYTENSVQKFYANQTTGEGTVTSTFKDSEGTESGLPWKYISAGSIAVACILLVTNIIFITKLKKSKKSGYHNGGNGPDDDDDDDEDTLSFDKEDEFVKFNESDKYSDSETSDNDKDAINNSINNAAMYIAAMEATNSESEDIITEIADEYDEDIYNKNRNNLLDKDNEEVISELVDILDADDAVNPVNDMETEEDFEFIDIEGIDANNETDVDADAETTEDMEEYTVEGIDSIIDDDFEELEIQEINKETKN